MRKTLSIATVAAAALALTSLAVAKGLDSNTNVRGLAGTFSATTASKVQTRTCTTTDGKTITVTDGKYTGTATGDADLTGAITLRVRSVINTTDKVGTVNGAFRIDVSGRDTVGAFSTVYDNGAIAGLATARAHDPGAKIVGNVSATFDPATGFAAGAKIGGGTSGGSAVELGRGSCKPAANHPEHSAARGAISSLSTASVTVAGLTCNLPANKAADINAKFKTGDNVEIRCEFANGANTLTRIEKRGH